MTKTIQVIYTCGSCDIKDRKITVIERNPTETVIDFMNRLTEKLSADHFTQSPQCRSTKMNSVKIPILNDNKGIGYAENT